MKILPSRDTQVEIDISLDDVNLVPASVYGALIEKVNDERSGWRIAQTGHAKDTFYALFVIPEGLMAVGIAK